MQEPALLFVVLCVGTPTRVVNADSVLERIIGEPRATELNIKPEASNVDGVLAFRITPQKVLSSWVPNSHKGGYAPARKPGCPKE